MKLVQILLPIKAFDASSRDRFERVLADLTAAFGGATAGLQSPAQGLWEDNGEVERDRIVTVEVMVDAFDAGWWFGYRRALEAAFGEKEIVIRAIPMEKI